ncbi:MAG: hypothetical protein DMG78_24440, partial [Acidobacteria bacterium]
MKISDCRFVAHGSVGTGNLQSRRDSDHPFFFLPHDIITSWPTVFVPGGSVIRLVGPSGRVIAVDLQPKMIESLK